MPILGVNIAIIQGGKVLLTKRRDFEVWCLPGGEVDDGESLSQAAVREAQEEVGLVIQLERLVGVHSRPQWLSTGGHIVLFAAKIVSGELTVQPQEVLEARFFSIAELPDDLLLGHRQQIEDALHGVCGAVWTHNSEWNFSPGLTRHDLYALRDDSGLSPADFYLNRVAKALPGGHRLEVQGKVDVY
ncbi:MAG TPA: NUDIX domain-containing protein [Anaerolineales bacterium]|nr:NUDIX domain-containing protein [Anaerolineales bacterium]